MIDLFLIVAGNTVPVVKIGSALLLLGILFFDINKHCC